MSLVGHRLMPRNPRGCVYTQSRGARYSGSLKSYENSLLKIEKMKFYAFSLKKETILAALAQFRPFELHEFLLTSAQLAVSPAYICELFVSLSTGNYVPVLINNVLRFLK